MPTWKKPAAKAPFATFMQPLQYDLWPSAAKHKSIPPAAAAGRNLDAACKGWVAKHNRIATRYCRTHRFDAAVPIHKASQHMQNTICTASTKKRKSHLEPSVPLCAQFETESTAKQRRPRPSRKRADFSPQPNLRLHETKTHNVSCKSEHSNRIHGAAVPMQSAKNDLQNK